MHVLCRGLSDFQGLYIMSIFIIADIICHCILIHNYLRYLKLNRIVISNTVVQPRTDKSVMCALKLSNSERTLVALTKSNVPFGITTPPFVTGPILTPMLAGNGKISSYSPCFRQTVITITSFLNAPLPFG